MEASAQQISVLQQEIEKLKDENRKKTHWISLLSHNYKEVFGSLLWLIEAFEQGHVSREVFTGMLPQIKADAQRNLKSVTDTSSWIKTQYGNFSPHREKLSAYSLFQELEQRHAKRLQDKEIRFVFLGEKDLIFDTDAFLISFVLDKLLENAVQFSFAKGVIEFVAERENERAKVGIIDYGTGVPQKWIDKMFDFEGPLFEGTEGEKGAGLSLKIVKEFAELIDAHIRVQSTKPGTKVMIYFP